MQNILRILDKVPLLHLKAVRFIISGGSASSLNFAMLWAFTELLHIWYLASLMIAIVIGAFVNFTLQKFWTFENHSTKHVHIQVPQFILLNIVNLILNSLYLYVLVEYLHVWYLLGQVICVGTLAIMNFFIYRNFIFLNRD